MPRGIGCGGVRRARCHPTPKAVRRRTLNTSTSSKTHRLYGWNLQTLQQEHIATTNWHKQGTFLAQTRSQHDCAATSDLIATMLPVLHTTLNDTSFWPWVLLAGIALDSAGLAVPVTNQVQTTACTVCRYRCNAFAAGRDRSRLAGTNHQYCRDYYRYR
jgi:hypothetical protein